MEGVARESFSSGSQRKRLSEEVKCDQASNSSRDPTACRSLGEAF